MNQVGGGGPVQFSIEYGIPAFRFLANPTDKKTTVVRVEKPKRIGTGLRSDILAKAIGYKRGQPRTVVDATAGLGRDLGHLLQLGCEVMGIERVPELVEALKLVYPTVKILCGDASELLERSDVSAPDVVLLDPMFPEKTKSARPGKESILLQLLAGKPTAEENERLFLAARKIAVERVVVKRPLHAPLLSDKIKPNIVFRGKAVRFDVYLAAN